jgi:outer membrane protein TolC
MNGTDWSVLARLVSERQSSPETGLDVKRKRRYCGGFLGDRMGRVGIRAGGGGFVLLVVALVAVLGAGCRSPARWRGKADTVAAKIITATQLDVLGRSEAITVDSPADTLRRRLLLGQNLAHSGPASQALRDLEDNEYWTRARHLPPAGAAESRWSGTEVLKPTLVETLQIAARNSREFQAAKDRVFRAALALDLERKEFRSTFSSLLSGLYEDVPDGAGGRRYGVERNADGTVSRKFRNGTELSAAVAVDLVRVLSQEKSSSLGLVGDVSLSVPLLRGAGRLIVAEPLRQAERDVVYAIYGFEQFKRTFAVQVATEYLDVLMARGRVTNQEENYKSLVASTRRNRRLADSGRLPELQFDQAVQSELRARESWVQARFNLERSLDRFKVTLGLPPDARLELDDEELARLQSRGAELTGGTDVADYKGTVPPADAPVTLAEPGRQNAGPLELDAMAAVQQAPECRPDLKVSLGRVEDAQRDVMVAADRLRAELTLLGKARVGESRSLGGAGSPDASWRTDTTTTSALLTLDLPFERTSERNAYRDSLIRLEQSVRDFQAAEDDIKLRVRDDLRSLLQARESVFNQSQAVRLAEKRVRSTDLFLQAGRAAVRDLLEAQDALLTAQNALISAVVSYRTAEWDMQRDLGKLEVTVDGLWQEYRPERTP